MPRAITKLRFKTLPQSEQAALRGGIAAINAVLGGSTAKSAAEITTLAFAGCAEWFARGETDHLLESMKADARAKGWSDAQIEGEHAAKVLNSYEIHFVNTVRQMGGVLEQLIRDKRWLGRAGPGWAVGSGSFVSPAAVFLHHAVSEPWRVVQNEKGFVEIVQRMKFKTALGLVAWTIIRLSQLRYYGHVALRCAECQEFKIVSVSKRLRFCSPNHRNLFNVHKHRTKVRRHK